MRRSRQFGMTLIEVLVAIAVLGLVTMMIWAGFSQTSRNKRRTENTAETYHVLSLALERMVRDLSTAFVSAHTNPSPSLQKVQTAFIGTDDGDFDRIDMSSFSHQRLYQNAHESDAEEVSYFVTDDPRRPRGKVLARRQARRVDEHPKSGGQAMVLVDRVLGFELEYLDSNTNEWTRTWDTRQANGQPNRLPSQVKIILTVNVAEDNEPERTLRLATRATLPLRFALNHAAYNP
ncbi:MAG: prepilin-type N-terminal cleavage/methylation domain-containing protein [Myxococcales bacterium]|nr:prepilin-type N-terminal cleavage/methylation domain-containing protein [Myxococcales bacterium]MCB9709267.1 prepilin-type N-terminal cleavage/methylation domain-containing protein [Myxococcales bacterium]